MNNKNNASSKTELIVSNTYLSGFYEIVDRVKELSIKNMFENYILVVPDKFSLNAEQIFMERMGTPSVFNVWLTTLSRLVSKVCDESEKGFSLLSKSSGTMLVGQIILKNIDKISTYKKISNNYSLAETMYNVINLLKSSGVRPEELKKNFDDTNFGLKIKDIYTIYSEYEKCMDQKIDIITRLQIFDEKVKNSEYIRNSHVYFSMFDGFTNVQINSLANLAKNSKSFCLSLCANTLQSNHYIYDNTLFFRLKDCFDSMHINYTITNTYSKVNDRVNFLTNNLFSYSKDKQFETDDIRIMECDNVLNEVRYVASRIKFLINERGYCFDDINVAVNGFGDYQNQIENIFDEYDLPYYIDKKRTLADHFFLKTLFKIFDFVCGEKTMSNAIDIVKSPIFEIEYQKKCDFENYCKKYNIFGKSFFSVFDIKDDLKDNAEEVRKYVFENIKHFEDELNNNADIKVLKQKLMQYLDKISIQNVLENIVQNEMDTVQKQIDLSVFEKFKKAVDECDDLILDQQMQTEMFFDMIKSVLSSVNLQTAPIMCDAIFVGDASTSTYYPRKVLFVMGATQERMPSYQTDAGTITDDEIERFVSSKRVSPTIKELNKREKFKLFNLILTASDLLELSFSTLIAGAIQQKSEFFTALQNVITQKGKTLNIQKYNLEEQKIFDKSNPKLFTYLVGTKKNALKLQMNKDSKIKYLLDRDFADIIEEEKNKYKDNFDRLKVKNTKKYLFKNDNVSISQIERYFQCPFMQFVDYGIRPKENKKFEIKANDVGKIYHKVAQIFVDKLIKNNMSMQDVDSEVKIIFDDVISQSEFSLLRQNKYYYSILKDELKRFCRAIKYQIDNSDFKPIFTEKYFNEYKLSNGLKFVAIVDRIDAFKDYFKILDYKTGSEEFSFKKLYYGLKLQLIAYMKVVADNLQKDMVGAAYMPARNKYNNMFSNEYSSYQLDGVILNDDGVIKHLDKNLIDKSDSDILNIKYKKDGNIYENCMTNILSRDEFNNLTKYTFDVLTNAIDEMIDGYIEPKPYSDKTPACKYCKYKSLCHYNIEKDGYRKLENKNKSSF